MASVFKNEVVKNEKSIIDIIKESVDVDAAGTVRFRSRIGRGSGKAVEIPGDQFDEFVNLMLKTKEIRQSLASEQNVSATTNETIITKE